MHLIKKNEPINVMIYSDGRAHVSTPDRPTPTQKTLFAFFEKGWKNGEFRDMPPGRYHFAFTKVGLFQNELELIEIVD